MINLAQKDVWHSLSKFIITSIGVGMLLGIVLIMMGVYRGMVVDAKVLLEDIHADIWVVQQDTLGPFAQSSRIHEDLRETIQSIQGIQNAIALTFQNIQLYGHAKPVRVMVIGYDPISPFSPYQAKHLIAGKDIEKSHYELLVSVKTGFKLGEKIEIGRNLFTVVGLLDKGTVSSGGDPLIYMTLRDAQEIQFSYSNDRIRTDRARGISVRNAHLVNAIVARVSPGFSTVQIANHISRTHHKNVFTNAEETTLLTHNVIEKASKQIGMFTAILIVVSIIIIGLIIFTMTLEKIKEISIMKLIGLPNRLIIKMIIQEALVLGVLAFIFGMLFSHLIADKFPKRVTLEPTDALILFIVVIFSSILASIFGVNKVIKADPAAAIGG